MKFGISYAREVADVRDAIYFKYTFGGLTMSVKDAQISLTKCVRLQFFCQSIYPVLQVGFS